MFTNESDNWVDMNRALSMTYDYNNERLLTVGEISGRVCVVLHLLICNNIREGAQKKTGIYL